MVKVNKIHQQPINAVLWCKVEDLKANNYNPNHVLKQEMQLLLHSILRNGWLQPIIINKDKTIIDGYHRASLVKTNKKLYQLTDGHIPIVQLNLDEVECKLLTIRINRAKGTHTAYKMHEVIKELYTEHHLSINTIAKEIGANKEEIELLIHDNIFQKEQFNDESLYSQAWIPK
jgi:ParB-like chromosome segregation protein Spo0J